MSHHNNSDHINNIASYDWHACLFILYTQTYIAKHETISTSLVAPLYIMVKGHYVCEQHT
jgi:hypothetical protein